MSQPALQVSLRYDVHPEVQSWVLPEGPVPESRQHDLAVRRLVELVEAWVTHTGLDAIVTRNLALKFFEHLPRVGIDPDVALISPRPAPDEALSSLKLWQPGHAAPRLSIEVVSHSHPYKDYGRIQERYAACGAQELLVLDPELYGPAAHGGPYLVQQWQLRDGVFTRVYAGTGPVHSPALGAWVWARPLGISDDHEYAEPWLTVAEQARRDAEGARESEARARESEARARQSEDAERRARLEAEARVAALERKLAGREP